MNISVETLPLSDKTSVKVYTLSSDYMQVRVMTYGGIVLDILVPDKDGRMVDVSLGFSNPEDYVSQSYLSNCPYFGALIGRYANRIKNGRFSINEQEFILDQNNGTAHLHGGLRGFDKIIWDDQIIEYYGSKALQLSLISEDGDQGYPGNVHVHAIYYFDNDNGLGIDFRAVTDRTTPINLTFHGYFNLSGEGNGNVLDHVVQILAPQITEVNLNAIPTGNIIDITNTAFDFTSPNTIGSRINQLQGGYDHNYVRFPYGDIPKVVAIAESPETGIKMTVWTTQPGIQFYTGNFLDATLVGKSGNRYGMYSGFCLETQHFPDSPNNAHFPRTLIEPGEVYQESTIYRFDTK